MNKKFLSALALGAITLFSVGGGLSSCKDYDDDIKSNTEKIEGEISARKALEQKVTAAESAIADLQSAKSQLETNLSDLQAKHAADVVALQAAINNAASAAEVANLKKTVDENVAALASLNGQVADLKVAIETLQASLENYATKKGLEDQVAVLNAAIDKALVDAKAYTDAACALKADKTDLDKTNATLTQVQKDLADALAKYNTLNEEITKINAEIAKLQAAIVAQEAALKEYADKGDKAAYDKAKVDIDALKAEVKATTDALQTAIDGILSTLEGKASKEDLKALKDEVAATYAKSADVTEAVGRINASISSISDTVIPAVEASVRNVDSRIDVIAAILSNKLRSLVFMPELYVDGIEAIKYPYITGSYISKSTTYSITRQRPGETYEKTIDNLDDYKIAAGGYTFGPAWPVQYHLNPSTAGTKYGDIKGFLARKVEVVTRALNDGFSVTSPEKYSDGTQLFDNSCGILTAGLQVSATNLGILANDGPSKVVAGETGNISEGYDHIIALQAYSEKANAQDTTITSDYAMIRPVEVTVDGLIWRQDGAVTLPGFKAKNSSDELSAICGKKIHVWNTPEEALIDNTNNLVQLYYQDRAGIQLDKYLALDYNVQNASHTATSRKVWNFVDSYSNPFEDLKKYGITYEFELVDYSIDGNKSHDSRYCTLDKNNGTIVAQNVKEDGVTYEDESATSVDREPLVRVIVKHNGGVILDGYILVHITKRPVVDPEKADLTVDFEGETSFDLCNGNSIIEILNWSKFSQIVLTQKLENMEKETFDSYYGEAGANPQFAGAADGNWPDATSVAGGGRQFVADLYSAPHATKNVGVYGTVIYRHNESGTTNAAIDWTFEDWELEMLTHDANYDPVASTYTAYIRWSAKNVAAPYPNIWVKLTAKIKRADALTYTFGKKGSNYWKDQTGKDNGWYGIIFNSASPLDNMGIAPWENTIPSTLVGNVADIPAEHKYYFTPETTIKVKAQNGTQYEITPRSSASDVAWKTMYPFYSPERNVTEHEWISEDNANEVINKCAIDYSRGVYTNAILYAVAGGVYTRIATMNQTTGEVTLTKYAEGTTGFNVVSDVLNAFGYPEKEANGCFDEELRTKIGVIAKNTCGLATRMKESVFAASWERPINIREVDNQQVLDANTNANKIYLADILHIYDWRGDATVENPDENDAQQVRGCMELPSTKWLWAYYNIHSIHVNCDPNAVKTNLHQSDPNTFVKMKDVNPRFAYLFATSNLDAQHTYTFSLRPTYNNAASSSTLFNKFQSDASLREQIGYIYYDNNGDNVEEFDVIVPITITYEWGKFTQDVKIKILRTLGNANIRK